MRGRLALALRCVQRGTPLLAALLAGDAWSEPEATTACGGGAATPARAAAADLTTPPDPEHPTIVGLGLFVEQVASIDHNRNTYDLNGFLDLRWCDPRLAFDAAATAGRPRILLEDKAVARLGEMWWPDVEFVNEVKPRESENRELEIFPSGLVDYRERFSVTAASHLDMHRFPFDTQQLVLEIESFAWSSRHMRFHVEDEVIGVSHEVETPGWRVLDVDETIAERKEVRDREPFSEFVGKIRVVRDAGFYVVKVIIPLSVIALMVSVVTWLPPDALKDRIGATLTGLLTAAAFGFTVSNYLPRHVYDSFLDRLILFCFVYMACLMVVNGLSSHLAGSGRRASAERLDRIARAAFPLGYLSVLAVLFLFG